jgi:hypothetical protein
MRSLWRLAVGVLLSFACLCANTWAHEEKLAIGEIEAVNLQRNLLVVNELQTGTTIRLTVDTSTEVKLCQRGMPVSAVQVGQTVRVKYLEKKAGGQEALSVLILPGSAGQKEAQGAR